MLPKENPGYAALLLGLKILGERYLGSAEYHGLSQTIAQEIENQLKIHQSILQKAIEIAYPGSGLWKENYATQQLYPLKSLFTEIYLAVPHANYIQPGDYYLYPRKHFGRIPYPEAKQDLREHPEFEAWQKKLSAMLANLDIPQASAEYLLTFLQRYTVLLPAFETEDTVLPLYDVLRLTTAVASCLNFKDLNSAKPLLLFATDLSGVQDFIYTISSQAALKTLRSRSFYLELLTRHLAFEILEKFELSSANIIYAGGGKFYLLLPNTAGVIDELKKIRRFLSQWLHDEFSGRLHIAITWVEMEEHALQDIQPCWTALHEGLEDSKKKKFIDLFLDDNYELYKDSAILGIQEPYVAECQVCHTDTKTDIDTVRLHPDDPASEIQACEFCRSLIRIGGKLKNYHYILCIDRYSPDIEAQLKAPRLDGSCAFYVIETSDTLPAQLTRLNLGDIKVLHKFAVNDLDRVLSIAPDAIPYFTETYVTENVKGDTADFQELANRSVGADFIGALRMDVDNLGLIFSDGLKCLPGIAYFSTLSRNLEYFFKFYMNSICAGALLGDESRVDENFRPLDICGKRQCAPSRAVSIIYSGGDDLFLVGAWDEVTELSFDIEKSFRKLTCQNPDVSLSGGIVVKHPDYPLYLTASEAKMAEGKAKGNWDVCSECVENLADLSYSRFQCLLYRQMGETGQVITMTLNKLLERGDIIHEVIVIHTSTQDKNVKKAVEGLKDQFTRPSPDKYILFFKGERDCGADKDLIINQLKAKESSLIDENGLLNIKLTLKELDILDIRSLDDANKVQDELYACVIDQKVHQRDFVISLAGGRKTMSGADAIAAQNIGSNLLCHVTEPGGELRDRYQPPLKSYELVIMNVPNIHPLLEHAQWTSEKFKDIFDEPSTFREKLGDLSKQVRVVSWLSAQDTIHDLAKNYLLSQANFTLVNLLRNDRFPSDLADILRAVKTNVTFMIDYLRVLDNVHRQLIGKINISRLKIRVRDIVDRMLNLVQCNFAAEEEALNVKGISFQNDVEENCHIDFNEEVLKYVFFNLFTNSIKAINKRRNNNSITTGTIRVENESVGQGAVIRIIDDGIGFDGDSERFFEPYFSTEERADVPSGIGLALVRGILSQYEAKIKLSSPGIRKGCTAEISIP